MSKPMESPASGSDDTVVRGGCRPDDAGSISTEYAVLLALVLVLTIFTGPQLVMWWHAQNLAQAATQAGVRTASSNGAASGSGSTAARSFMDRTGGRAVNGITVQERSTPTTVTVEVTATVPRIIPLPGLNFSVRAESTRERERFTTPGAP